jgi:hypothetical protein
MRMTVVWLIVVGIFGTALFASAEMDSTSFLIEWDTVSQGGTDDHSSASYLLRDTVGNVGAGSGSSGNYDLRAGYRQGIFDRVITFDVAAQEESSERDATALAGTTITADTSGLSVGDLILLVQDEGDNQVAGIGRITSVAAGSFEVDELKDGGGAPVIDGTDDVVYLLRGTLVNFGTLDPNAVTTQVIGFEVTADLNNGYTVQVFDDGNLRDGTLTINDVSDGDVTATDEEYGGRSSDTTLADSTFDTEDTAFTEGAQDAANESENEFESKNFVTLKASVSPTSVDGDYAHIITLIVSGNF